LKEAIRYHALRLFDKNGFHGTSMRDIGEAAGCKMPTVYHHYGSKENLFDELARVAYIDLVDELSGQLKKGLSPQDYCAESAIQKKKLSEDGLIIHRLAMKTWLGCEGCEEVRQKLIEWEYARIKKNEALLNGIVSSPAWVRIITRTFINLIERIILFCEDIPDDDIREEMRLLFESAKKTKESKEALPMEK
jgi:AcrR family transcriptional regulator